VIPNLGLFLAPWVRIMLSTVSPFHRHTLPWTPTLSVHKGRKAALGRGGRRGIQRSLQVACCLLTGPIRLLKVAPARRNPCQTLTQQLCSAPWIPDKSKIIAASSYSQLANRRVIREMSAVCSTRALPTVLCSPEWQTLLVLCICATELKMKIKGTEKLWSVMVGYGIQSGGRWVWGLPVHPKQEGSFCFETISSWLEPSLGEAAFQECELFVFIEEEQNSSWGPVN
jgi:hypothetical protein